MTKHLSTGLFALVLFCALMPWVTFSCAGEDLLSVSGVDLAVGVEVPKEDSDSEDVSGHSTAVAVMAAAILGLVTWAARGRVGTLVRAGFASVGFLMMLLLKFDIEREARLAFKEAAENPGEALAVEGSLGLLLNVTWEFGYWVALAAFISIVAIQFKRFSDLRRSELD